MPSQSDDIPSEPDDTPERRAKKEAKRARKEEKKKRKLLLAQQQQQSSPAEGDPEEHTQTAVKRKVQFAESSQNGRKHLSDRAVASPSPSQSTQFSSRADLPPPFFPHNFKKPDSKTFNASDLPPGFDFSALTEKLSGTKDMANDTGTKEDQLARLNAITSTADFVLPEATSRRTARGPSQAALDAAMLSMSGGQSSSPSQGRVKGLRNSERISKSKQLTISDAAGLSQEEILSRKLYQPHQLKWLEEEGILVNLVRGKFTPAEMKKMTAALGAFAAGNGMTEEEAIELITSRSPAQAELYADLTSEMAASVEGRHLRSVRRFALEHFHPGAKQGHWTEAQQRALAAAYAELGPKWVDIGKRIGRLARDCRTRWRDHGDAVRESRQTGRWNQEEVDKLQAAVALQSQALGISSDDKNLPWSAIALSVGTRPSSSCLRKWDEIQLKRKTDSEDLMARLPGDKHWFPPRDEKLLVERLLQQDVALRRGSIEAVDWSEVASGDLAFTRETLSRSWRRLRKAHLPGHLKDAGLREQLQYLLPGVQRRYEESGANGKRRRSHSADEATVTDDAGNKKRKSHSRRKEQEARATPKPADVIDSDEEL